MTRRRKRDSLPLDSTVDTIRRIMRRQPRRLRGTNNQFYDTTYPILVEAGRGVHRYHGGDKKALAILALGLTGWNQGARHGSCASHFIKAAIGQSAGFTGLIHALDKIECRTHTADSRQVRVVENALNKARRVLGVVGQDRVPMASKLLHFLSPAYFPIMDRHVHVGLGMKGSLTSRKYVDFTLSLWYLDYAGKYISRGRSASVPKGKSAPVSVIRAVECTLYRRGKRRKGREG